MARRRGNFNKMATLVEGFCKRFSDRSSTLLISTNLKRPIIRMNAGFLAFSFCLKKAIWCLFGVYCFKNTRKADRFARFMGLSIGCFFMPFSDSDSRRLLWLPKPEPAPLRRYERICSAWLMFGCAPGKRRQSGDQRRL